MPEWLTLGEASELLGLSEAWVYKCCANGKLDARKEMHNSRRRWMVSRESIKAWAQKRKDEEDAKPKGKKFCPRCKKWKKYAEFDRRGKNLRSYCKPCGKEYNREWRAKRKPQKFSLSELLEEIGPIKPAEPQDSLKYACMDVCFAHRPIPIGQTKRQAFCANCNADRCVHHPQMTPEEVRRTIRPKVLYPSKVLAGLLGRVK